MSNCENKSENIGNGWGIVLGNYLNSIDFEAISRIEYENNEDNYVWNIGNFIEFSAEWQAVPNFNVFIPTPFIVKLNNRIENGN